MSEYLYLFGEIVAYSTITGGVVALILAVGDDLVSRYRSWKSQ